MLKYLLLAAPPAVYYYTAEVEAMSVKSGEYDRYRVRFTDEEKVVVQQAFAKIGSARSPAQLMCSAFYRSPSFAFERLMLAALYWKLDKNQDLFVADWKLGDTVSNSFRVAETSHHQTRLDLNEFSTELFFGNSPELQMATYVRELDTNSLMFRSLSLFHNVYSRCLLAGAKYQLLRDLKAVLKD